MKSVRQQLNKLPAAAIDLFFSATQCNTFRVPQLTSIRRRIRRSRGTSWTRSSRERGLYGDETTLADQCSGHFFQVILTDPPNWSAQVSKSFFKRDTRTTVKFWLLSIPFIAVHFIISPSMLSKKAFSDRRSSKRSPSTRRRTSHLEYIPG